VEFKSTVRTNLKTGKPGKEIEFAWLKAVVAFLNSSGGTLLIGVDDSGRIVGIEPDGFENADKCQLHLKNLINQHIGAEYSSFIQITLVDVDGMTVVLVECSPAREPVFLKIGKNEEFYIRSGPSSIKLSPSQTVSYVLQNMKTRK
jgi:predicted HTH transcriptional regulator